MGKETIKVCGVYITLSNISFVDCHQALLEHNAKVYMASRSRSTAEEAIKDLKEQTGKEAIFLELNLANLSSVRKAAEEFLR